MSIFIDFPQETWVNVTEVGLSPSLSTTSDLAYSVRPFRGLSLCFSSDLSKCLPTAWDDIQTCSTVQEHWPVRMGWNASNQPTQPSQGALPGHPSHRSCSKGPDDNTGPFPRICLLNWMPKKTIHERLVVVILVHVPQVRRRTTVTQ